MKRIFCLGMVMMLLLCSCGDGSSSGKEETNTPDLQSSLELSVQDTPSASFGEKKTIFEEFETSLSNAAYEYENVTMAAELVGAKVGVKYKFNFGTVELYQFEDGSKDLQEAIADGGLHMEGFGVFPCHFNGNLALLIDVTENEDSLLEMFNAL